MPDGSAPYLGARAQRRRLAAEARRRERRMSRERDARPASARLILDPLEPRVLLNADTLAVQVASLPNQTQAHDVLVQMVNDTITVGTQTQIVQRVQVIDQTSGAVLAVGDLSEIRDVAIAVTAGADKIALDLGSFGANTVPSLQVQGDGMTALAIEQPSNPVTWQVNGDGSGSAAGGGAAVAFTGVTSVADGGNDVLDGPQANTTWQITGPGSGSLTTSTGPATAFQGIAALAGVADVHNTFDVYPGGAMPGGIVGGEYVTPVSTGGAAVTGQGGYDPTAVAPAGIATITSQAPSGGGSGTGVTDTLDASISGALSALAPAAPPPVTIDPETDVSGNTITLGAATTMQTGTALTYSTGGGAPIGELVDGATYYAIVTDRHISNWPAATRMRCPVSPSI